MLITDQKKHSLNSFLKKLTIFIVFFIWPFTLALNTDINTAVTDGFHEGEYLSSAMSMHRYYTGAAEFPVLVHGAMDYIPSTLARIISGDEHVIAVTRLINTLIVALCWALWLNTLRLIMPPETPYKHIFIAFFLVSFWWMCQAANANPVDKQQAFLGVRDLFLILSIYFTCKWFSSQRLLPLFFAAACSAASLYWSYDRGIMAAVWIAALAASQAKAPALVATLALGYVASAAAISISGACGGFLENLYNVFYWLKHTSEVWGMPKEMKLLAFPYTKKILFFVIPIMVASTYILVSTRKNKSIFTPLLLGLMSIQLILLVKLYSLPGAPTRFYFAWPSILLLIIVGPRLPPLPRKLHREAPLRSQLIQHFALAFAAIFTLYASFPPASTLGSILAPSTNASLVPALHFGTDKLSEHSPSCIFQWSNEGFFSLLAKSPPCTKYPYAVYISKTKELEVLAELRNSPPPLIIYDSPFWSMAIYGNHMRDRLPLIDAFIQENYAFSSAGAGYVFGTYITHENRS